MNRSKLARVAGIAAVAGAAMAMTPGLSVFAQQGTGTQPGQTQPDRKPGAQPGTNPTPANPARPGQPGDRPNQPAQPGDRDTTRPGQPAQPGDRDATRPGQPGRDITRPGDTGRGMQPGGTGREGENRSSEQMMMDLVRLEVQLDSMNRDLEMKLSNARTAEGEQQIGQVLDILEGILEEHTKMNEAMRIHRQMMASSMGGMGNTPGADRTLDPARRGTTTPGADRPITPDRTNPGADRPTPTSPDRTNPRDDRPRQPANPGPR